MSGNIFPEMPEIPDEEVNERFDVLAEHDETGIDGYPVPFSGSEQSAEKKAVCRHIIEMSDAIRRVAPMNFRSNSTDTEDWSKRSWQLCLDIRSPSVFVSESLRKRICEMMLAADHVSIATSPDKEYVRFTFIVTDLWRS